MRASPGAWAALLAIALLGGCAALKPTPPAHAASAAAIPSTSLDVRAPDALKVLLERNLDLARVGALSGSETIDDDEWSRLIDAAPAQARELLQTEGYFDPKITLVREPGARRVELNLDPGPRVHVARVTIAVDGALERAVESGDLAAKTVLAELRRDWRLPVGKPFRNADWTDAKAAALAQLRADGYATASWNGTGAEIDPATHEARLFVVAESGPLFRFGQLDIQGLVIQDLDTVRNLADFPPGAPVTDKRLLDYQDRLQKSGLFDGVVVTLDTDPDQAGAATVRVRLREAPLQVWTIGLGISANTGPRLSAEHKIRRIFGHPATARNKVEWGSLHRAWDGEISSHTGVGLYRSLLGGTVDWLRSNTDLVLSQSLRLGRAQSSERIERLYYAQVERSARSTDTSFLSAAAVVANYHLIWRDLDSALLPTEGWSLSAQGGFGRAHGTAAPAGLFTRLYGRLTAYRPLGRQWYGQARVELGQVFKKDAVAVPQLELFRAGGDDSVRGYSYRSLGPLLADGTVTGGNSLFTTSLEFAHPLAASMPSLWGAVFIDAGDAADSLRRLKPRVGTGVGLRWRSPVGPLNLDWAWAPALHAGRLTLSVGIAY
jgi:translocation and assembly module TamA